VKFQEFQDNWEPYVKLLDLENPLFSATFVALSVVLAEF